MYAVEASEMADYARKLIAGNPLLSERITVGFILASFISLYLSEINYFTLFLISFVSYCLLCR